MFHEDLYGIGDLNSYLDFSLPNGDRRQPHPDPAPIFADERSCYVYEVGGLNEALVDYFGEEFTEESKETEIVHQEPRRLAEILEAEQEYFDKIWYVRKLILIQKIEAGEHEPAGVDRRWWQASAGWAWRPQHRRRQVLPT